MIDKEKILRFIRANGPIIPVQLSKEINQNILMSSAILSEMVSKKELKVSNLKIGGTPLYYIQGQEPQLQNYSNKLPPKEKDAYDLMRMKKVLREKNLDPIYRITLRMIKDFSVPLRVTINNNEELFWKWYLTPNDEAETLIKNMLGLIKQEVKEEIPERKGIKPAPDVIDRARKEIEIPQQLKPEPSSEPKLDQIPLTQLKTKSIQKKLIKPVQQIKEKPKKIEKPKVEPSQEKKMDKPLKPIKPIKDELFERSNEFFQKNKIEVKKSEIIKKGEVDFIIKVPSVVGGIEYYCKARSKKRISEPDISSAFIQGKEKNLPVLYLNDGDLSKKVEELLPTRFKGLIYKRL
ncbi:MAG: hypothetical protein V1740_07135 [Candidatus Woesearchaeota archaeon]